MFSENLKALRKQKGFSQEELATRLHVARQTISKWEKNLSVPDADTLIRLAEILEVSVSELLGEKIENENATSDVAEQLSRINEQLAIKNRRSRRMGLSSFLCKFLEKILWGGEPPRLQNWSL